MFSFTNGETKAAPLIFGFDYNNVQYRMHMTPDSGSIYPYPETDYVDITCTGADANNQCDRWQIKPNGTKGGCLTLDCSVKQNVVKLVKLVTTRNTTTEVDLGDFYMAFSIGITNP
jgi:hypothetical protein